VPLAGTKAAGSGPCAASAGMSRLASVAVPGAWKLSRYLAYSVEPMSGDPVSPVSRAAAGNARLRAGLEAARRAGGASARPRDAALASDADRDRAAGALQSAYADGRLDRDQFEARLTAALTAARRAAVSAATAGLPESPVDGGPAPAPRAPAAPMLPGRVLAWLSALAACIVAQILRRRT
jgi:Domain of unknown function (DUF1707)